MAARLSATAAGRQSLAASCGFPSLHHWACRTWEVAAHLGGATVAETPVGMIDRSGTKRGRRFMGMGSEEGEDGERRRDQREREGSAREGGIDKRGRDRQEGEGLAREGGRKEERIIFFPFFSF